MSCSCHFYHFEDFQMAALPAVWNQGNEVELLHDHNSFSNSLGPNLRMIQLVHPSIDLD